MSTLFYPCSRATLAAPVDANSVPHSQSVPHSESATQQQGKRVGLVATYSGDWVLESGKNKRPIKKRGFSVYENERPMRVSKDGSLTVVCVNNTTAVCPGNHKIGEPFLLSDVEQVDDWWSQFLPFISNYGSWIFPASRNLGSPVSLEDAVVCLPSAKGELDVSDLVAKLPEGAYKCAISEIATDTGIKSAAVKFDVIKRGATATATVISAATPTANATAKAAAALDLHLGIYSFQLLSGPTNSKLDWSSLDPAIFEIASATNCPAHKANLQMALKKTELWKGTSYGKNRIDLVRSLLAAQSKAPAAVPKLN